LSNSVDEGLESAWFQPSKLNYLFMVILFCFHIQRVRRYDTAEVEVWALGEDVLAWQVRVVVSLNSQGVSDWLHGHAGLTSN
jgi:hypothetical protein